MDKNNKVILRTKEISESIGEEAPTPIVDYYWCYEWRNGEIGRCIKIKKEGTKIFQKNTIIYDKYIIDYGDWDLIETLIVHECCHLKYSGHGKDFQDLFKSLKSNFPWDVTTHALFCKLKIKLKEKKILKSNGELEKRRPINKKVVEYLQDNGIKVIN